MQTLELVDSTQTPGTADVPRVRSSFTGVSRVRKDTVYMNSQIAEKYSVPTRLEVLRDLEPVVGALMERHLDKRRLWYPSQFLPADEQTAPDEPARTEALRERA